MMKWKKSNPTAVRFAASCLAFGAAFGMCGVSQANPDVIVGDIPDGDVMHYTSTGAVAGKRAYSFGTTSCNIGTTPLTWIDCGNPNDPQCRTHPVISQNMYRLVNGRFEQIGQGWLKHGFCALQGTVCGACTPGGNCDALFPGCSDPYSAGLNGSQSGLGPKSEVNAATGVYPYPWINNGSGSGALFKRCQVLETDLTVPNSLFFFASSYVQPEDAAAGNDNNNQSYRRITINQTTFNPTTVDTTQRTKPAIMAWKDHGLGANQTDPNVIITPVDIPGDGRFLIGAKATNLGGGQYHYEYAIQNLNSDRSGGSFTIPLPPGAIVTNVGFRDVDYHSGDPYDNTDWSFTVSASGITWNSPATYAQNQNSNALRWDTIYNFRFDANVPPSGGVATLGLFKPGTPSSATFGTVIPSPDGLYRPLNDNCVAATPMGAGTVQFDTTNANTDGPAEPNACNGAGSPQYDRDVWYLYQNGSCAGTATVSLCGSAFNSKVAIYAGSTCPTNPGTVIACNDNTGNCPVGDGTQSEVNFSAAANATYLIRIGGHNNAGGEGSMTITAPSGCGPQAPQNDNCANATWAADGVVYSGSTTLATNDGTTTCNSSGTNSRDVWFRYRPVTTGVVRIDTCGSTFDTVLSIYGACGGTQLACNDDSSSAGPCYLGPTTVTSFAAMVMNAGQTYTIRLGGFNTAAGTYNFRIVGGGGVTPPGNDVCANRSSVSLGDTNFTTLASATDGPAHSSCGGQIDNDVWFDFHATLNGRLRVRTCGSGFDTKLAVYDGAGCNNLATRLMNCNNDSGACGGPATSEVDVVVVGGQDYTIRVGGNAGASGNGVLRLVMLPTCIADMDNGTGTGTPDGGVTIDDLLYYLGIFEDGSGAADVDDGSGTGTRDGGVTIDDLLFLLLRFEAGC